MLEGKIIRSLIFVGALIWTAWIVWTILRDPLYVDPEIILPALCCAGIFVGLACTRKTHRHK